MRRTAAMIALAAAPACYFDFSDAELDGGGVADARGGGKADGTQGADASHGADGGGGDGGGADGGMADAAAPDAGGTPLPPVPFGPFSTLSESGLYTDIASKGIRLDVMEFKPEFALWTDGAAKTRWIWLPPGTQIGTGNMGRWVFPVGTTAWKEFRDPVTGKRLETRIIQRLPNSASGAQFYFASFVWNQDDSEAVFDTTSLAEPPVDIPDGCADPAGGGPYPESCHVVPQQALCNRCHGGEPYKLLGFSAVQLSHDGPGLTLSDLVALDLLSAPPPAGVTYPVPGTPVERAAIGTLHANCGHCHYAQATQQACFSLTDDTTGVGMAARVLPGDATVQDTAIWQSAVGQPLDYWTGAMAGNHTEPLITTRIVPGDPQMSAVWYRMSVREWGQPAPFNDHQQMPTLGTNEVDPAGLGAVELWIQSLSP